MPSSSTGTTSTRWPSTWRRLAERRPPAPAAVSAAVSSPGARHRSRGAPAPGGPGDPEVTASLGLVVPLFNEADRLGDYGKQLADFVDELPAGSELLFVDDG